VILSALHMRLNFHWPALVDYRLPEACTPPFRGSFLLQPGSAAAALGAYQSAAPGDVHAAQAVQEDFDVVRDLMIETGVLERKIFALIMKGPRRASRGATSRATRPPIRPAAAS
jgi:hypothetical protein